MSIAFFVSQAQADWQQWASTSEGVYYYDDVVLNENARITLSRMVDFAKPLTNLEGKEIASEKTKTTLDCNEGKLAHAQVIRYAGTKASGDIMNQYETPLRFTRIAPNSADEFLLKQLCPSR